MRYQEKLRLKNGAECLLRSAVKADAEEVLRNIRQTHAETDYLLTYPDEMRLTVKQEEERLAALLAHPRAAELVALLDGAVVATAGFEPVGEKRKILHRAGFGISVEKRYWGLGIGRALLRACIACAKEAGYTQLELEAVADNAAALALYAGEGFVEYGRNPRGFRADGGYRPLVDMRKELEDT